MLQLFSRPTDRDCEGLARRDFLQAGTLGLGSLSLPWLLQQKARAAESGYLKNKSIVYLFLSGGATHIETFNPNMNGPTPSRSMTGEVKTTVPGLTFGGTFPLLAKQAHQMAVVRSFQHPIGGHVQAIVHLLTGGTDPNGQQQAGFSLGSAYTRLRGTNHELTGMPTYSLLNSEELDPQYRSERGRVESGSSPGSLGAAYAPFIPGSKGPTTENMKLQMEADRLDDRRALLNQLDVLKQQTEQVLQYQGVDRYTEQAFDVLLGDASTAFDLSLEDRKIFERYDTSHIEVGKKKFRPSNLGKHLLTARRLIEKGCGFVTVHSAGWDMHADGNNPGIAKGMNMLGRSVDRAVSAFLEDLDQRGMLDDVLLVITGDFGRTPKINARGGRDHWPRLCTLAFAGGGIGNGQIIGQSNHTNGEPASEPVTTSHLMATVMHSLFDVSALRLARGVPRDLMQQIERNQPIPGLV
ncbi:MAG: DUF1501 domain-containing protein [Planctomycetaceae bacterium]|nr:DUF1501 domain-containing protein [Planctomycetaceae bacterium]